MQGIADLVMFLFGFITGFITREMLSYYLRRHQVQI